MASTLSQNGHTLMFDLHDNGGGAKPLLVFFPGFRSDRAGTKALHLIGWAREAGIDYLRLDYSGHGESEGAFEDGCIGQWHQDSLDVITASAPNRPLVIVGSSMGGWLALLAAKTLSNQIKGLVLIAAAPDFTEKLMWPNLTDQQKQALAQTGRIETPSDYSDEPTVLTQKLFDDGRNQQVMHEPILFDGPVRLVHGMADVDVPFQLSIEIAQTLTTSNCEIQFLKSGDHRLSSPEELSIISHAVASAYSALSKADSPSR